MASRAAVFIPARDEVEKFVDLRERDFFGGAWRKAVCKRCGLIITDFEPGAWHGEFRHDAKPHQTRAMRCMNNFKTFSTDDSEIVPFMPKARRRYLKRAGIRA